jgi:hypothetical protein
MDNWVERVNIVKQKFADNGFTVESDEILNCQLMLGTPGEIFTRISHHLNEQRNLNSNCYMVAKYEIDDIISYAKSINYL